MRRTKIGIIRGGQGHSHEQALSGGAALLLHIDREQYQPVDVFIDQFGTWHVNGVKIDPIRLPQEIEGAWVSLADTTNRVKLLLDDLHIAYAGSGVHTSSLCDDLSQSFLYAKHLGIKTPRWMHIGFKGTVGVSVGDKAAQTAYTIHQKLVPPWIIKSPKGNTFKTKIIKTLPALVDALIPFAREETDIFVEELINGRKAKVGVISQFRKEPVYVLPSSEKRETHGYVSPGAFSPEEKATLTEYATKIHNRFGLRHFSESEFIVTPKGIYFVGIDAHPTLSEHSSFGRALSSVGSSVKEFIGHTLARLKSA